MRINRINPNLFTAALVVATISMFLLAERFFTRTARILSMSLVSAVFAQGSGATLPARPANAAVVKAADGYLKAVLAADAHRVAATYTEDAVELPNGQPPVIGRAAIEARWGELFKGVRFQAFTFSHIEATIRGDVAYDVGTYELRLALPDGRVSNDTGKYVVILKQSAGAWKATYAIYNSNAMPAGAPAPETDRK
jgi:ketosteroid isomerase-like protein